MLVRVLVILLVWLGWGGVVVAGRVVRVAEFGALGDGVSDDGPALRRALAAAVGAGAGSRLVFERKTYRLGERGEHDFQMVLERVNGLSVEGNGARLLATPRNGIFLLRECRGVRVAGFLLEHDPLPFTQGTIVAVDAAAGAIDLEVHAGYRLPPADAEVKARLGAGGWEWGSVIDARERHLRWDVVPHFFIASVAPVEGRARVVRITVTPEYAGRLAPVRAGDRFFLPLPLTPGGARALGANIQVSESGDCELADMRIHSARSGMNFALVRNEGRITLRRVRIEFGSDPTRVVTTWRDGVHCKNNRVGPLIEDCHFEGMLDDSINLSADTAMASAMVSEREFRLHGAPFAVGDRVMVFDPVASRVVGETRVAERRGEGTQATVVLADPVAGVVTGSKRPHADVRATHFYNLDRTNSGFVVRGCTFLSQRRHAVLVRSNGGVIENNRIEGVGGSAVSMGNELGSFYEGPFPHDNIIRNNSIADTQGTAIAIYSNALGRDGRHTRNIEVRDNRIRVLPGKRAISLAGTARVTLAGNSLSGPGGAPAGPEALSIERSDEVRQ